MPPIAVAMFLLLSTDPALKTVWDGVYTSEQAARGEAAYADSCSGCHRDDLRGYNGVLVGGRFMDSWREDTLNSFFRNVKKTMPRDAPSSLSDATYLDIVAYILKANAFPSGKAPLTIETLPDIRVEAKQGPQPVPDFSLVSVVGCLTQSTGGSWILIRATEPVRTRNPGDSTTDELKALKSAAGTHQFHMMDIESVHGSAAKNQLAEAKGFLIRHPDGDKVSLTSLRAVGSGCEP